MKNFFRSKAYLGIMLALIGILSFSIVRSQTSQKPFSNKWDAYSQMWNMSNTYFGTITYGRGGWNGLGGQIDTAAAGGAITLSSAIPFVASNNVSDSGWYVAPISSGNQGSIEFTLNAWKASSTTTTVTATVYSSSDGVVWATIPGVTTSTLVASTVVTGNPTVAKISVPFKYDRFYKIIWNGDATNAYAAQSWWYFLSNQIIQK